MLNIIESSIFFSLCYIFLWKEEQRTETKKRCWFFQLSSDKPQSPKEQKCPHKALIQLNNRYSFRLRVSLFQCKTNATWADTDSEKSEFLKSIFSLSCHLWSPKVKAFSLHMLHHQNLTLPSSERRQRNDIKPSPRPGQTFQIDHYLAPVENRISLSTWENGKSMKADLFAENQSLPQSTVVPSFLRFNATPHIICCINLFVYCLFY